MAREAGVISYVFASVDEECLSRLKAFEALVRADERARLQPKKIKAVQKDEYCQGDERYYANE
jgi:hypothetical protein